MTAGLPAAGLEVRPDIGGTVRAIVPFGDHRERRVLGDLTARCRRPSGKTPAWNVSTEVVFVTVTVVMPVPSKVSECSTEVSAAAVTVMMTARLTQTFVLVEGHRLRPGRDRRAEVPYLSGRRDRRDDMGHRHPAVCDPGDRLPRARAFGDQHDHALGRTDRRVVVELSTVKSNDR